MREVLLQRKQTQALEYNKRGEPWCAGYVISFSSDDPNIFWNENP
jgi:hypothetical protein